VSTFEYNQLKNQLDRIEEVLVRKNENQFLDITEAARFSSLSKSTLRRAIARGELKYNKKVGKLLFKRSDIEKWLSGK
jgi:excisionase family DNA binding protein